MATQVSTVENQREGAEIFTGNDVCREKSLELLESLHLPRGLLPLPDLLEVGHNPGTGFVWLKQKKATTHTFKKIGKSVWYADEVTAFVEDGRMRKLTGVKSKELLIWVTLTDICIDKHDATKIYFKSSAGVGRSFPASAFQEE